jgi:NodT family efflux transporter outer membrane factor (OMF) lipoprotein
MVKNFFIFIGGIFILVSCVVSPYTVRNPKRKLPETYYGFSNSDTSNTGQISWKKFFKDTLLISLIDSALINNQELQIFLNEVELARNDVRFKKAQYLPFINMMAGSGIEKPGRYTSNGAVEEQLKIEDNKKFPELLPNLILGSTFSWEADVWGKLKNSKKAAMYKYFSAIEGKKFLISRLVTEVASFYYELIALDNQLEITENYLTILKNALEIVRQEKSAARTTELAVKRFEAEVHKNQSKVFYIKQHIVQTENQLNYLLGRNPQAIKRNSKNFLKWEIIDVKTGIPSQLLLNRPDVRRAEYELMSSIAEVKSAKAEFYPSFKIEGLAGFNAYHPSVLLQLPHSLIISLAGEFISPLVNRNALKANYFSSIARQNKASLEFEKVILNAYQETVNQLNYINNMQQALEQKNKQAEALNACVDISVDLFKNARADYLDILLTQREALDAKFELIETKKQQLTAHINLYRALGGGWR